MIRAACVALVVLLAVQSAGCASLQRKFTRKTKKKTITPKFYAEGSGETRPNLELYMTHYMYWKTWHEDIVQNAGENAKRDRMAVTEMIGSLADMKRYLSDEKAAELQGRIEVVTDLSERALAYRGTAAGMENLKRKLDNERARIVRGFYYKKVKDHILPD